MGYLSFIAIINNMQITSECIKKYSMTSEGEDYSLQFTSYCNSSVTAIQIVYITT